MNRLQTPIKLRVISLMSIVFIFSSCSMFGIRSGWEQLPYKVVEKDNSGFEIREYPERLVAEVNDAESDNNAFMTLFRYISGKNSTKEKIAMTSPVEITESEGEEIAMTVPVETDGSDNGLMRFFLPAKFTKETAPEPLDETVKIRTLPTITVAALDYSWFNNPERFTIHENKLRALLKDSNWKITGEPFFLGYDPPYTIPFLRKNEILIPISER